MTEKIQKRQSVSLLLLLGLAFMLTSGSLKHAFAGNGIDRGGGQGREDETGRVRLRDLLGDGTCKWIRGQDFPIRKSQEFKKLLATIRGGDKQLYFELFSESLDVEICLFSGHLRPLPSALQDEVGVFRQGNRQIAVRIFDEGFYRDIYIDNDLFNKMPKEDQAGLLLHELLHSNSDRNSPNRMIGLRTFVREVSQRVDHPFTPVEFESLEVRNRIFPNNRESSYPSSQLHYAMSDQNMPRLKILVEEGGFLLGQGIEPLSEALEVQNPLVFKYLFNFQNASLTAEDRTVLLEEAAKLSGNEEAIEIIAQSGPWDWLHFGWGHLYSSPSFVLENYRLLLNYLPSTISPREEWSRYCKYRQVSYTTEGAFQAWLKIREFPLFKNSLNSRLCSAVEDSLYLLSQSVPLADVFAQLPETVNVKEFSALSWTTSVLSLLPSQRTPDEVSLFLELVRRADLGSIQDRLEFSIAVRRVLSAVKALKISKMSGVDPLLYSLVSDPRFLPNEKDNAYDLLIVEEAVNLGLPKTLEALLNRKDHNPLREKGASLLLAAVNTKNLEIVRIVASSPMVDLNHQWNPHLYGEPHSSLYWSYCLPEVRKVLEQSGASLRFFEWAPDCR